MKKKLLNSMRVLLAAAGLLVGATSAWADPIETVGESDCSTTDNGASSTPITLNNGKFIHYVFTQNRINGGAWDNQNGFFLIANNGTSDIIVMRQDAWENIAGNGDGFSVSWDWTNDGATWLSDMNGATVDMYVSLNGTTFSQTSTITSSNKERTYTYSYTKTLDSEPASLDIRLSVHYSYLQITTADLSTTVTYDFTSYTTSDRDLTYESIRCANSNSVYYYYPTNFPEVFGRFAFQHVGTMTLKSTGLLAQRTNGDHIAVMGLAAHDKVTINFSAGAINLRGTSPDYTTYSGNGNDTWNAYTSGTQLTMNSATNVYFQAKNSCNVTSIVIETVTAETVSAPSISSEANGDARTVTITDGASNLLSSVTTYYTTNGDEPTASSTEYTAPFDVDETCTIKAITISNSSAETASTVSSQLIDLDVVDTPTAAITAVDGVNRTVTFSCTTDGVTLSYSIKDGDDWGDYVTANSLVISENTTLKVKAVKSEKEAVSGELSFEAGTAIKLNAPTYTIGAYSEGAYTLTVTTDQSKKLLAPTASIKYTVDGGSENTIASGETIDASVGTTIKIWSAADGYTKSDDVEVTPTYIDLSTYRTDWSTDFKSVAATLTGSANNSSTALTLSGDALVTGYYNITNDGFNSKFGVNNVDWQVRYYGASKEANTGLWPYNVNGSMVITDLSAGDVIVFTGDAVSAGSNVTKDGFSSTANSNSTFEVSADGYATFTPTKSGYIYSVTVYTTRPATVSRTITAAGWATYCSPYALDFSSSISGLTNAYFVTGGENGVLTLSEITGTIPANTGILLEGEGTVAIPVVASSSTSTSSNKLTGVTEETALAANGGYVLMNENDHVGFYLNNNAFTVGANTAYLPVGFDETGDARAFYLFGDESTGISAVENTQVTIDHCYNLNGQRVSQPAKGLYIVNGKKVIVK